MLTLLTAPARLTLRLLGAVLTRPENSQPGAVPASVDAQRESRRGSRTGKYDEGLVALVNDRPGITVAQAATVIGVDATALYPVIRRLQPRGALIKRGRELHPVTGS